VEARAWGAAGGVLPAGAGAGAERAAGLDACQRSGRADRRGGVPAPALPRGAAVLELGMGGALPFGVVPVVEGRTADGAGGTRRGARAGADRPEFHGDASVAAGQRRTRVQSRVSGVVRPSGRGAVHDQQGLAAGKRRCRIGQRPSQAAAGGAPGAARQPRLRHRGRVRRVCGEGLHRRQRVASAPARRGACAVAAAPGHALPAGRGDGRAGVELLGRRG